MECIKEEVFFVTFFCCSKDIHVIRDYPNAIDTGQKEDTLNKISRPDPNGKEMTTKHEKNRFWCSKCVGWNLRHTS